MECVPLLSAQLFALFDFFFIKTYVISSIFIECEEKIVMRVCVCVFWKGSVFVRRSNAYRRKR